MKDKLNMIIYFLLMILLIIVVGIISGLIFKNLIEEQDDYIKITVTDRSFGENANYIKTQGEIFEVEDENLYSQLEIGKTYIVKVDGVRNARFHWYRRIIKVRLDTLSI